MSAVNSTESSASLPPPPSRKPKGKSKTPTNTGTQQVEYGNSSNKPLRQEGVISSAPVAHPSETVDDSRRGSSSGNPEVCVVDIISALMGLTFLFANYSLALASRPITRFRKCRRADTCESRSYTTD